MSIFGSRWWIEKHVRYTPQDTRWSLKTGRAMKHWVTALGLETITILPPDPDLSASSRPGAGTSGSRATPPTRERGHPPRATRLRHCTGAPSDSGAICGSFGPRLGVVGRCEGPTPDLQYGAPQLPPSLSAAAYVLRQAEWDQGEMSQTYHIQGIKEFHELDELGTTPPPVCMKCKGLQGLHVPPPENSHRKSKKWCREWRARCVWIRSQG